MLYVCVTPNVSMSMCTYSMQNMISSTRPISTLHFDQNIYYVTTMHNKAILLSLANLRSIINFSIAQSWGDSILT